MICKECYSLFLKTAIPIVPIPKARINIATIGIVSLVFGDVTLEAVVGVDVGVVVVGVDAVTVPLSLL